MAMPLFSGVVGWVMAVGALLGPFPFLWQRRLPHGESPWGRDDKFSQAARKLVPQLLWMWDPMWPALPTAYKVLVFLQYPVLSAFGFGIALGEGWLLSGALGATWVLWAGCHLIGWRAQRAGT